MSRTRRAPAEATAASRRGPSRPRLRSSCCAPGGRRWRHAGGPLWADAQARFGSTKNAETTLSEWFAQGDIDETEYRARLEVLRANQLEPGKG